MSISYLSFPVVNNEEESDYYNLLRKNSENCRKDIYFKSEISQICHSEEKKKNRNDDSSTGVRKNDNEEINLIITNEKNIQSFFHINKLIKVNDKNENRQKKNYPFNSSKINNSIKEESKPKYLSKNKIIIDKKSMIVNLDEKQTFEKEEEKVIKDALDDYVKEEKERIKKSKKDKFKRLKIKVKNEEKIKIKRIEEETEMKIKKIKEDILIEQENEFQIVDDYANKELENIYVERKKEALNEKIRNSIESLNNQKKTISLREESDNEEPKENQEKKRNKSNKNFARSKIDSKA